MPRRARQHLMEPPELLLEVSRFSRAAERLQTTLSRQIAPKQNTSK